MLVILPNGFLPYFTVHAAARGEEDSLHPVDAHGLQHVVRQACAVQKIHIRIFRGAGNIGIRGKMINHIMALHGRSQLFQITDIGLDNREA